MLFVNDTEGEIIENRVVGEDGVGADDEVGSTGGYLFFDGFFVLGSTD